MFRWKLNYPLWEWFTHEKKFAWKELIHRPSCQTTKSLQIVNNWVLSMAIVKIMRIWCQTLWLSNRESLSCCQHSLHVFYLLVCACVHSTGVALCCLSGRLTSILECCKQNIALQLQQTWILYRVVTSNIFWFWSVLYICAFYKHAQAISDWLEFRFDWKEHRWLFFLTKIQIKQLNFSAWPIHTSLLLKSGAWLIHWWKSPTALHLFLRFIDILIKSVNFGQWCGLLTKSLIKKGWQSIWIWY